MNEPETDRIDLNNQARAGFVLYRDARGVAQWSVPPLVHHFLFGPLLDEQHQAPQSRPEIQVAERIRILAHASGSNFSSNGHLDLCGDRKGGYTDDMLDSSSGAAPSRDRGEVTVKVDRGTEALKCTFLIENHNIDSIEASVASCLSYPFGRSVNGVASVGCLSVLVRAGLGGGTIDPPTAPGEGEPPPPPLPSIRPHTDKPRGMTDHVLHTFLSLYYCGRFYARVCF
ncbi:hypothetical protein AAG570_009022 [Ranatra chinensis]|uniref:Uncharacterized protein n=1 Tax=Ranatra chinensis TaxID=642074 RepID=A0ABD0YSN2_9HEMI